MRFTAAGAIALLLGTGGIAHAAEPRRERRQPSEAEVQSFTEFFDQRTAPASASGVAKPPLPPVLSAERELRGKPGKGPWQLSAIVDTRPRHAAEGLCHILRSRFRYDAIGRKDRRWTDDGAAIEYLWLSGGPIACGTPKQLVALPQALPPADLVSLLEQQATLLSRARLLFAGNTSCARQRAYKFDLAAITSAAPQAGASAMYDLTYRSDRATTAHITVRKKGPELTAWNVNCLEQ